MDTDFEEECKEIVRKREEEENPTKTPASQPEAATVASAETSVQKKRPKPRHRVSNWAKGCDSSKKKRKITKEREEENGHDAEEEEHKAENGEEDENGEGDQQMEVDEEEKSLTNGLPNGHAQNGHDPDLETPRRRSSSRATLNSVIATPTTPATASGSGATPKAASTPANKTKSPSPKVAVAERPTSVQIDRKELDAAQKELIRVTEGHPVEKLERWFAELMEIVVNRYGKEFDRRKLPADIMSVAANARAN